MGIQKYNLIRRLMFVLGAVLFVFQLSLATVSADSSQLLQNIGNDDIFYNSNSPTPNCSSPGSGSVSPEPVRQTVQPSRI